MDEDEDRGVPPCVADAARRVTKIRVAGNLIGIMEFDRVLREVEDLGPMEDTEVRKELIERTKKHNYIPPSSEEGYADALLVEFKKRCGKGNGR
jgi:hypothetical protein